METPHEDKALAAAYAGSVEREREAWDALRSFPPGSIGRARAWEAWSQAIVSTNRAWRRLNAGRIGQPVARLAPGAARSHARA